ncbi:inorganic phosphate transporter [Elusimicrobiota bacterium]
MFWHFFAQLKFLGGVYLGWGGGANDTANIFGPAVATGAIKYRTAVIFASIFVLLGSVIEGPGLMEEVAGLAGESFNSGMYDSLNLAFVASLAAGITITILTYLAIPASTSQASVGSIMGIGIVLAGFAGAQWAGFLKMFIVWVANPLVTAVISFILYKALAPLVNYFIRSSILYNRIFGLLMLISGSYGAYTLGASHAAVTTAPFYKSGVFGDGSSAALWASFAGGVGMVLGITTYSKKVMKTVGSKIAVLDPFTAFVSVLGAAITVHMCKIFGVPVSTSQAIVGSVIGVGLVKGARTVNFKSLRFIFLGWLMTPVVGAVLCYLMIRIFLK